MFERIAAKAGKLAESIAGAVGDFAREDLDTVRALRYADQGVNSALFVPDAFGKFTIDYGREKPFLSYSANRPGIFRTDGPYGGGQLEIEPGGTAIYRVNGKEEIYSYQSFREHEESLRYLLFKPGLDARGTLASVREFWPTNNGHAGGLKPIRSELRWDVSENADTINREIPKGSVPIGIGEQRQAWQTPTDQALVIGPLREYPNIPGVLQPERSLPLGNRQFEWFRLGENHSVTAADVSSVNDRIKLAGYTVEDSKMANYIRTRDGIVWRIDPDGIVPKGQHRVPRSQRGESLLMTAVSPNGCEHASKGNK